MVPTSEVTKQPNRKDPNTMADELRIGLSELLRKAMIEQDADFLKEGVRVLSQALIEMEVQEHVGAGRHERSPSRTGQRNGYRERTWAHSPRPEWSRKHHAFGQGRLPRM